MKVNYDNAMIRKSNSLIEASYKLSLNEQRLVLMLIASVKKEDKDFQSYRIPVKVFSNFIGINNKNIYKEIKELIISLQKKTLTISREKSVLYINWLSSLEYFDKKGIIELSFDPKLKSYLLNLKKCFTSYRFQEVAQLKSSFAIRIYELLRQYENLGSRTFTLEKLRYLLGIEPDQYQLYSNFKNRVILVAQKELAKSTNISFDFKEIKVGRKIGKICFTIKQQPSVRHKIDLPIRDIEESSDFYQLVQLLPEQYRKQLSIHKILQEYLKKHEPDYVARNIEYTNANSNAINPGKNLTKKSNYRSYLTKSLNNDFGLAHQEDQILKKQEGELREQIRLEEQQKQKANKLAEEREKNMRELIQQHLDKLPEQSFDMLKNEAVEALDGKLKTIVLKKRTGWKIALNLKMIEIMKQRLFPE